MGQIVWVVFYVLVFDSIPENVLYFVNLFDKELCSLEIHFLADYNLSSVLKLLCQRGDIKRKLLHEVYEGVYWYRAVWNRSTVSKVDSIYSVHVFGDFLLLLFSHDYVFFGQIWYLVDLFEHIDEIPMLLKVMFDDIKHILVEFHQISIHFLHSYLSIRLIHFYPIVIGRDYFLMDLFADFIHFFN